LVSKIVHATQKGVVQHEFDAFLKHEVEDKEKIEVCKQKANFSWKNARLKWNTMKSGLYWMHKIHPFQILSVLVDATKEQKNLVVKFCESKLGFAYNDIFASNYKNSSNQESYYCCQLIR